MVRIVGKLIVTVLVLLSLPVIGTAGGEKTRRTLSGTVYYTNNTPPDMNTFPVELFTSDQKKRIAATRLDDKHRFELTKIKPGKYLLKLSRPGICVLWYRIDLTSASRTNVPIIMDVDCAHHNGEILNL